MMLQNSSLFDPGGSRHAQNSTMVMGKLENKSPQIEVKLGLYRFGRHLDSNGANDTQIQVCMLKL